MKKKLFTTLRALLIVLSMLLTTTAGATNGDYTVDGQYDGSADKPYQISDIEDWNAYSTLLQDETNAPSCCAVITQDIGTASNPITKSLQCVKGTLDGQGHTLYVDLADSPIIQLLGGTIKQLNVTGTSTFSLDSNVKAEYESAEEVDYHGGIVAKANGGTIEHCSCSSRLVPLTALRYAGIVGLTNGDFTMRNCVFSGSTDESQKGNSTPEFHGIAYETWTTNSDFTFDNCMMFATSLAQKTSHPIVNKVDFGISNCSCLSEWVDDNCEDENFAKISREEIATGQLTYRLQGLNSFWGQNLSAEKAVPMITTNAAYRIWEVKYTLNGVELAKNLTNASYTLLELKNLKTPLGTTFTADYQIGEEQKHAGDVIQLTADTDISLCNLGGSLLDDEGTFLVKDDTSWNLFCTLVNTYKDTQRNAKMMYDVWLDGNSLSVGSASVPFVCYRGSFDGQGHKLLVPQYPRSSFLAPFECLGWGAKIANLHTTGTWEDAYRASGLVFMIRDDEDVKDNVLHDTPVEISRCISDVHFEGGSSSGASWAGFVNSMWYGKLVMNDCGFCGKFKYTGNNQDEARAFGITCSSDENSSVTMNNCYVYLDCSGFGAYKAGSYMPTGFGTFNNCYSVLVAGYNGPFLSTEVNSIRSYDVIYIKRGILCNDLQAGRQELVWGQDLEPMIDYKAQNVEGTDMSNFPTPLATEAKRVYRIIFQPKVGNQELYDTWWEMNAFANAGQKIKFGDTTVPKGTITYRPYTWPTDAAANLVPNYTVVKQTTADGQEEIPFSFDLSKNYAEFTMPEDSVFVIPSYIELSAEGLVDYQGNTFSVDPQNLSSGAALYKAQPAEGTQHIVLPESLQMGMYRLAYNPFSSGAFKDLDNQQITYVDMSQVAIEKDGDAVKYAPTAANLEADESGKYTASSAFEGLTTNTLIVLPKHQFTTDRTNVLYYDQETESYKTAQYALKDDADLKVEVPIDFVADKVSYDRVFRNFTDGYATVMLPFGVPTGTVESEGQVAGGDFYTCTGITANCHCAVMGKVTDALTQPNTPYIYKMAADNAPLRMGEGTVQVKATTGIAAPQTAALSQDQVTLIGTYERLDFTDENNAGCYGYARYAQGNYDAGAFVPFAAGAYVPACRAYLYVPDAAVPAASKPNQLLLSFDDQPTGITSLPASTSAATGKLYNLAGQRVAAGYHGIVIRDGKKVKQ